MLRLWCCVYVWTYGPPHNTEHTHAFLLKFLISIHLLSWRQLNSATPGGFQDLGSGQAVPSASHCSYMFPTCPALHTRGKVFPESYIIICEWRREQCCKCLLTFTTPLLHLKDLELITSPLSVFRRTELIGFSFAHGVRIQPQLLISCSHSICS